MSTASIGGTSGNATLQWLESLTNSYNNNTSAARSSASTTNSNGTADLSQAGQFLSKLESLA
jgi:hypothetical protein